MPPSDWIFLVIFFTALLSVIGFAEFVRRRLHWSPETARKSAHILTGVLVSLTPFVLQSMWPMLILSIIFALLDLLAVQKGLFPGMHGLKRQSYGTVYYPISFAVLVVLLWNHNKLVLVTSMLIMALADAAAATVGENVKNPRVLHFGPEKKSLQGSLAMFFSTFLIVFISMRFFSFINQESLSLVIILWIAFIVALIATASELISVQGSDNLTVPLSSAFTLYYMLTNPVSERLGFTIGVGLALVVAFTSYKLKFLDAGGAIVTFLLASLVFGIGRWTFSVPILAFFILSSTLSKIGKKRKEKFVAVFEKSSRRDLWQVAANGGLPGLFVVMWYFFPLNIFYLLYVCALASVMADTWGTEIGILSKSRPRSIINFKLVAPGTSGGISLFGSLGALLGSVILVMFGAMSGTFNSSRIIGFNEFLVLSLAGLLGGMVDSYLGGTIQAQFQCPVCGLTTEKKFHCDNSPTKLVRGYGWINNDVVNFFCAISGALFVLLARIVGLV